MQLFTIGLYKLNQDGTHTLSPSGQLIRTYTNEDIEETSRVWTGFKRRPPLRGNIEREPNRLDPMDIDLRW